MTGAPGARGIRCRAPLPNRDATTSRRRRARSVVRWYGIGRARRRKTDATRRGRRRKACTSTGYRCASLTTDARSRRWNDSSTKDDSWTRNGSSTSTGVNSPPSSAHPRDRIRPEARRQATRRSRRAQRREQLRKNRGRRWWRWGSASGMARRVTVEWTQFARPWFYRLGVRSETYCVEAGGRIRARPQCRMRSRKRAAFRVFRAPDKPVLPSADLILLDPRWQATMAGARRERKARRHVG
jgi:hypothetical protein